MSASSPIKNWKFWYDKAVKEGGENNKLRKEYQKLRQENERLNKEIGKYTNQLYNIAQQCHKTGEDAQKLITKMLEGEINES